MLEYWFIWRQRFQRNLTDGNFIRKCLWGKFVVATFMFRGISLGKSFWVMKTWRAPVRKRLKGSTLNFAHTFLIVCCTKPCLLFFYNELFIFYCNNSTCFESLFYMKTVKSRLFKKYLERRKSRPRFCLSLGWLYISEKKITENCNSVGAGAQNIGKVVRFDPNFTIIWTA